MILGHSAWAPVVILCTKNGLLHFVGSDLWGNREGHFSLIKTPLEISSFKLLNSHLRVVQEIWVKVSLKICILLLESFPDSCVLSIQIIWSSSIVLPHLSFIVSFLSALLSSLRGFNLLFLRSFLLLRRHFLWYLLLFLFSSKDTTEYREVIVLGCHHYLRACSLRSLRSSVEESWDKMPLIQSIHHFTYY